MPPLTLASAIAEPAATPRRRGLAAQILRRLSAKVAALVLLVTVIAAAFPYALAPHDPFAQDLARRLRPPAIFPRGLPGYWLGTDQLGRDLLARIILGARVTLLVSLSAVAVGAVVGVLAGLAAGFRGGWLDGVVLRLIDVQLAFPLVLLVIAIVSVIGPSLPNLVLIMGISGWPRFARVVRGSVLTVRTLDYIEAARSIGASSLRVILRHVLPNVLSAIIVYASFEVSRMVLLEATLSFLGLGVQPPMPSWGGMIDDGRRYIGITWSLSLSPGVAIAALIFAFNVLGDELRDALDPQVTQD